jgi:hypothetical protein
MKLKALPILLVAAALACSTLKTTADFDPKTDFTRYKTWAFREDESMKNSILSKRIQSAVESELSKRGLTRNEGNPDLWVAVHVRLSKETQVTTYNTGWGYGYRWGGAGMSTATVQEIPVGSLIVDLVDANQKDLVWRGTASDTLNPEKSPEEKDKALREALAKMFENYPPRSK